MSPGAEVGVRVATLLLLLTINLTSGSDRTSETDRVVIQIGNIEQPINCSLFLIQLEVTSHSFYRDNRELDK